VRHHVRYVGGALGPKDVVLDDERTRACGRRSTTSGTPAAPWAPKTWCLTTKEQGFAGSGAPRPVRRQRLGPQRRGARRRKNKGLRGAEHHVPQTGGALGPKDVVLDDERTRACGRRSTTSGTPVAPWAPKTWCLTTKEQGFAGSGAPRPADRRRLGRQRRGARRRKNKGLRGAEHHATAVEPRPAAHQKRFFTFSSGILIKEQTCTGQQQLDYEPRRACN